MPTQPMTEWQDTSMLPVRPSLDSLMDYCAPCKIGKTTCDKKRICQACIARNSIPFCLYDISTAENRAKLAEYTEFRNAKNASP